MSIETGSGYSFNSSNGVSSLSIDKPFTDGYFSSGQFQPYDNGDGTFSVTPGALNGLIVCIDGTGSKSKFLTATPTPKTDYDWGDAETGYEQCFIYIQAGPTPGSFGRTWPCSDFMDENYPTIFGYQFTMDDDDATGYILLALAKRKTSEPTKITFFSFVNTSLWSERHKYSQPDSAYYYYYRV
jgi:hypothetical protein